jgi:hypothetical protein
MSFPDTAENRIARLRRARCKTEVLVRKILADIPSAIEATVGSP